MCDNEVVLEQTLNQYKDELLVVVSALVCDQNNNDLIELRDKLIEIIALTEVDLINHKKARLLAQLSSIDDNSEPKASTSSSNEQKSSDEDITSSSLIEALNELNGKECRVALSQQNGSVSVHNAVVMTSETIDSIDNSSEPNMSSVKVKVFFTYPMNNSMLPCPHYMSGKCRFSEKCKYSHGYEVFLKDIKPFEPIDYSKISRDSICLAKSKADSLWHKAVVEGVSDERIVIKYCDFDCVDSVDIEDILPLNDNCIESEPNFDIRLNDSINDDSNEMPVIPWNSSSSAMAEWEVHTKGIGSKLMTKMGYVWGKGLGRNGEGITQPIDVFVFPTGKSLDVCIEMKEKFLSNDELKQKIKIKQKKIENRIANGYNRVRPEDNVFDFINSKIFTLKKESSGAEPKSKEIVVKELKTSNTKSLNISSLKISEDIRKAEFELKRLNDSMNRNKTKDRVVFNQLKERVDKQNQLIQSLKHKESMIQKEQNSRNNKQKLSIF